MHDWGDKSFDWNGLNTAINRLVDLCHKARIGIHAKEKFGIIRASLYLWNGQLHELVYPGWVSYQWPRWMHRLDFRIADFCNWIGLGKLVRTWQLKKAVQAYQTILQEHPHLRAEILNDCDILEHIPGAIVVEETPEETLTHIVDWDGKTVLNTWHSSKR